VDIFSKVEPKVAAPNCMTEEEIAEISILVAEDNVLNQKVVQKVLGSMKCHK
jgi:hypothetical protein